MRRIVQDVKVWKKSGDRAEEAIVLGTPYRSGREFVIRYRTTGRIEVPPHWHPGDEHVTVLAGKWEFGFGTKLEKRHLTPLHAGGYVFVPKRVPHFSVFHSGTVVQVHGLGPFRTVYLKSESRKTDSP
jgi:quercetin dioxygenase-like cupin family protein